MLSKSPPAVADNLISLPTLPSSRNPEPLDFHAIRNNYYCCDAIETRTKKRSKDEANGSKTTLQNSAVTEINEEQFRSNTPKKK